MSRFYGMLLIGLALGFTGFGIYKTATIVARLDQELADTKKASAQADSAAKFWRDSAEAATKRVGVAMADSRASRARLRELLAQDTSVAPGLRTEIEGTIADAEKTETECSLLIGSCSELARASAKQDSTHKKEVATLNRALRREVVKGQVSTGGGALVGLALGRLSCAW